MGESKVKIFTGKPNQLEEQVNRWILDRRNNIELININKSQSDNSSQVTYRGNVTSVTICIWYEEI